MLLRERKKKLLILYRLARLKELKFHKSLCLKWEGEEEILVVKSENKLSQKDVDLTLRFALF